MILVRPGSGRNLEGMDSHVFRPIMTAFVVPGFGVLDVTRLKCAIS